jgi:DNA repair protein RecN (Recombination protein N)
VLSELSVRDLGVIEDLTIAFGPGMTALTGETGAGKTLVVEALGLALGARATAGLVRAGADEAFVEARFTTEEPDGATEVVLARALPAGGRSKAWIDGRPVPLGALGDAAKTLIDIHGQHDQQSLLSSRAQRRALDAFAGSDTRELRGARARLSDLEERIAALGGDPAQRSRELDMLRYQVAEIDQAHLDDPDEEAALSAEEDRLADLGAHREAAQQALQALDAGPDDGAIGLLGAAVGAFGGRSAFGPWEARLRASGAELADVASDLRAAAETWEDDPAALAEVQARRRLLGDLRRKYGSSIADVMAFGDQARRRYSDLSGSTEEMAALEAERDEARRALREAEIRLGDRRRRAAPDLAEAAGARLATLAMQEARFAVEVHPEGLGEPVVFLLGANPGEPPQPMAQVASGGELARAMLALRLVTATGPPTMVFDEVDAGVGGAAALALGGALAEVAVGKQVLVVTHLAQVAAFADRQLAVRKVVRDHRTVTEIEALGHDERLTELSRMLSGHAESDKARAHAAELLAGARRSIESTTVEGAIV